jgi:hypothetical protein
MAGRRAVAVMAGYDLERDARFDHRSKPFRSGSSGPASKSRRAFSLTGGVAESARVGRRGGPFALSPLGRRFGVAGRTAPEGPPCPENARTLGSP